MTNSLNVRTFAINQEVHREFARSFSVVECFAFEIRDRDEIFRHATFARHRGRCEDAPVIELNAHVTV